MSSSARPPVSPEISVILVAVENYRSLGMTMARLRRQTIRRAIEIVVVALDSDRIEVDPEDCASFYSLRVVPCSGERLLANAVASGVRAASAPFVAMIEDHCYPEPGWAEALLERHRAGYAVVGAEIGNANPYSATSWCSYLLTLGAWAPPAEALEVSSVAAHNSSYRRDVLAALAAELETLMVSETLLQWRLRESGHRIFLEPKAKAVHVNPSRFGSFVYSRFCGARAFAGLWSQDWPWPRRARFAAIASLVEVKRIAGIIRAARRRQTPISTIRLCSCSPSHGRWRAPDT